MARVVMTGTRLVAPPRTVVTVGGVVWDDVECVGVTLDWGFTGNQAVLRMPGWRMEDAAGVMDDAMVMVWARNGTAGTGAPLFAGFVDVDSRAESGRGKDVRVVARSAVALLDRVFVGQDLGLGRVVFPREDEAGRRTSWGLASVLRWLFAEEVLSANWRALVGLGSVAAVEAAEDGVFFPELTFTAGDTYLEALRTVHALAGRVVMRERYTNGGKVLLDWVPVNDRAGAVRRIQAPTEVLGPEGGATALEVRVRRDSRGCVNRVVGYGRNRETMVTCTTSALAWGERMTPAWTGASAYGADLGVDPSTLTAAEAAVLANPDLATPGRPAFREDYQWIFRRFKLPESLRRHTIQGANVLADDDGRLLPVQYFRERYEYTANPEAGVDARGSVSASAFELLNGGKITEDGYVHFAEPVVAPYEYRAPEGTRDRVVVYRRMHAAVTLTVMERDACPRYDTGVRGRLRQELVAAAPGLVAQFKNESVRLQRVGTEAGEWVDADGVGHTWSAIYWDPDAEDWQVLLTPGTPVVVRDDTEVLGELAEAHLAERNARRTEATVTVPGVWNDHQVGDMVRVLGRGIDGLVLQVAAVTFGGLDAGEMPVTVLELTDGVPQVVPVGQIRPDQMRRRGRRGSAAPAVAGGGSGMELADMVAAIRGGNANPAGTMAAPPPEPARTVTRFDEFGVGYQRENPAAREAARRAARRGQRRGQG